MSNRSRSNIAKSNRAKGHRAQKKAAFFIAAALIENKIPIQPGDVVERQGSCNGVDIILSPFAKRYFPYSVEVKATGNPRLISKLTAKGKELDPDIFMNDSILRQWVEQSVVNCEKDTSPLLIVFMDRVKTPLVVVPVVDGIYIRDINVLVDLVIPSEVSL